MCVESNSGVADPGAAAARPGTRVVEWLNVRTDGRTTRKRKASGTIIMGGGIEIVHIRNSTKAISFEHAVY